MLDTLKEHIQCKNFRGFEEFYIDYVLSIQDRHIILEMEYIKKHNKLDILKLDRWITSSLAEVV